MDVLSPKSLFYLEHRDQINAWANLESNAGDELHKWLCSWAEAMQDDESAADRELYQRVEDTRTPALFWYRDGWRTDRKDDAKGPTLDDQGEAEIHVGVGVEWKRHSPHRGHHIYRGVWVNRRAGMDGNLELQDRLHEIVGKKVGQAKSRKWWPYYVPADPLGRYIAGRMGVQQAVDDPDLLDTVLKEYQEVQLQALEELWNQCVNLIDDTVRQYT